MTLYTGVIILIEMLMFAMSIHVLNYSGFTRAQKTWYLLTFISIMICAAAEYISIKLDARGPSYVLPLVILTVIHFSLAPLVPAFFVGALGLRREATAAGALLSLNVVAEIVSAPFGWIFHYDAKGAYIRGPYYIIYQSFYILGLIVLIVNLFIVGKRFKKRDIWTIGMVLVIMIAAIIPLILYDVYTDYLGVALSACLCYIYYNDLIQEDIQAEFATNQRKLSQMQERIISGLANLIESRDMETGEHVSRTSAYVKRLAELARADGVYADQLDDRFMHLLYTMAPMHDIGKIAVSDQVLKKPGRLTPEEFEEMKKHAAAGGRIVREVLSGITEEEYLNVASDIAACHHERWDGTGYPKRLKGEEIPLCARIMAIADVFDALVSERCYKKPMSTVQAFRVIAEESGSHFDPRLAEVFLNHREEFERILKADLKHSDLRQDR